jgi:ammonium transporter, Amt family
MQFDTGNTGFMILATSLVLLMTPGLAFFYGGLVGRRNVLAIMFQSFAAMGLTTALWFVCGYSLCFSGGPGGFIGNLDLAFLRGISPDRLLEGPARIPLFIFVAYQIVSAQITPALITGAFANRMRFGAYLLFLTLWLLLVYCPVVHMVWGGGLLAGWGVQDFAGGIVVHCIAGFSALASVFFFGPRKAADAPSSIPLVAIGSGLLWFGWFGFNAGNALAADHIATLAFLNTALGGAVGAFVWIFTSWLVEGKPKFVGFMTGSLAGLVVVTPPGGFISPQIAVIIAVAASILSYFAIRFKNHMHWDDALDVWGVHGVCGMFGIICLGLFGSSAVNPAATDGLFFGGGAFFSKQLAAVTGAAAYAFVLTFAMLWVINKVTRMKVTESEETEGLDTLLHGEVAYS